MFFYSHKMMPLQAFVGMNGSGKTAMAVREAIRMAKGGKKIYTTVPIFTDEAEVIMLYSLDQLFDIENSVILLDEVNASFPARGTSVLPHPMNLMLSALRHNDNVLIVTSPSDEHIEINIRRVLQSITVCKAILRLENPGSLWPRTVISYFNQYDVQAYGDEESLGPHVPKFAAGFVRLKSLPLDAYDTKAPVGIIADHLICPICGGNKRKEYCSNDHTDEEIQNVYNERSAIVEPPKTYMHLD